MERIIFDLDNTLISNVDFNLPVQRAFEDISYNFTEKDLELVQTAIAKYEYNEHFYDEKLMLKYIKAFLERDLPDEFMYYFLSELEFAIPAELESGIIDTLDYLQDRYQLCVLTNWFTEVQRMRLENTYLLDYFDEVYGGEVSMKPYREAFISACNGVPGNKCLMIGDSLKHDFLGAISAGLNAYLLDKEDKYKNTVSADKRIREIKQLKKVL